jgi:1,4-alpha-glucan branching enzyme
VEPVVLDDAAAGWIALLHGGATPAPVAALLNFAAEPRAITIAGAPAGRWRKLLATDDAAFGGDGATPHHVEGMTTVTIPAYTGTVFELEAE